MDAPEELDAPDGDIDASSNAGVPDSWTFDFRLPYLAWRVVRCLWENTAAEKRQIIAFFSLTSLVPEKVKKKSIATKYILFPFEVLGSVMFLALVISLRCACLRFSFISSLCLQMMPRFKNCFAISVSVKKISKQILSYYVVFRYFLHFG